MEDPWIGLGFDRVLQINQQKWICWIFMHTKVLDYDKVNIL